jgi:RNA polymerase sigma-70 factor (ECF subfamily)
MAGLLSEAFGAKEDVEGSLVRICERAEATFPTLRMDRAAFVRWLGAREAGRTLVAPSAELDADAVAELWLCAALAAGVRGAAEAFEARYLAPLPAALGRLRLSASELDELTQIVRTKLLVHDTKDGGEPLVAKYAGKGRLAGFVKVTATREAISRFRSQRATEAFDEEAMFLPASGTDPGLSAVKREARTAFRESLVAALGALEPRDRNLLRLHLLGGVTLERLATMHGKDRATIVRWLRDARARVLDGTKRELGRRLAAPADEVESLIGLATSNLDVTLERLLRTHAPATDEKRDQ